MNNTYIKKYQFDKYTVKLHIDCYYATLGNQHYFGLEIANNYVLLEEHGDSIVIHNDLCGLFRLYYWQDLNVIYITDNVFSFMNNDDLDSMERHIHETYYFEKHHYSSGDSTFYKKIKKIPPSGILKMNRDGLSISLSYSFAQIERTPNEALFRESIRESVVASLKPLQEYQGKIILCYSGGTDSHYIATLLQTMNIDFELAYFLNTSSLPSLKEKKNGIKGAKKLGKQLHFINISQDINPQVEDAIKEKMYFDKHFSKSHFYGIADIVKKWGNNIILINGQNADSILSYGPSEKKITSLMKRYLLYGNCHMFKMLIARIISVVFNVPFSIPKSKIHRAHSFYDLFKYCLLYAKCDSKEFIDYIDNKILTIEKELSFSSENNLFMYLKLFTHIQGSDSQVVIQSAKFWNIKLLMPFSTSDILFATLKYKDDCKEMIKPKYILRKP
jgi:asparagine synthetase B (glutamine-hydrolysing)